MDEADRHDKDKTKPTREKTGKLPFITYRLRRAASFVLKPANHRNGKRRCTRAVLKTGPVLEDMARVWR